MSLQEQFDEYSNSVRRTILNTTARRSAAAAATVAVAIITVATELASRLSAVTENSASRLI